MSKTTNTLHVFLHCSLNGKNTNYHHICWHHSLTLVLFSHSPLHTSTAVLVTEIALLLSVSLLPKLQLQRYLNTAGCCKKKNTQWRRRKKKAMMSQEEKQPSPRIFLRISSRNAFFLHPHIPVVSSLIEQQRTRSSCLIEHNTIPSF